MAVAIAATGCYKRVYTGNEDFVTNYDNVGKKTGYRTSDWPVNFIFYGPGANVNRVKSILNAAGASTSGGAMYLYLKDFPSGGSWDTDSGRKKVYSTHSECGGIFADGHTYIHMRVYADSDDRLNNSTFGNYVVGTSHWDNREGCSDETFGWSESAEAQWASLIYCRGYNLAQSHDMQNPESSRMVRGNHYWQSDGWARKVYVPSGTPSARC